MSMADSDFYWSKNDELKYDSKKLYAKLKSENKLEFILDLIDPLVLQNYLRDKKLKNITDDNK
jgi:hypothetical protein